MAKTALITGASSGIGRELARQLSAKGFKVILTARREDRLRELAQELEGESVVIPCDLSRREECIYLYEKVKEERIGVLVNNAGFGLLGDFTETELNDELRMIDTNITALHILTKLFLKDFVEADRGYILNVASSAGLLPGGPLMATYYATKAYVTSLTSAIYGELEQKGSSVHISALCPGPVETEFNDVANARFSVKGITPEYCAKRALEGLFTGELIIVPEKGLKLVAAAGSVIPRKLAVAVTGRMQSSKKPENNG